MGNLFITPQMVARDAAIALRNRLICANHVSRQVEGEFKAQKIGDKIKVTIPPAVTDAKEFTGSTEADDVKQRSVDVKLEHHFYKRADLTTKQQTLEMDAFTRDVTVPYISGIGASIDKYLLDKMRRGFSLQHSGDPAYRVRTYADVLAGHKELDDRFIPQAGRVGLVDTGVKQNLLQLPQFSSRDYGNVPADGQIDLGLKHGVLWVMDPHSGVYYNGDTGGTVTGTGTSGQGTLALADLSAATGVIRRGTAFTVAGDTTRYVVTADTAIAGNAVAALPVFPLLRSSPATAKVTWEVGYSNMLYHPRAVAAAIVAPEPLMGGNSAVASFDGLAVRVSFDSSITSLTSTVVYDVFVGSEVVQPDAGIILGGSAPQ